MKCQAISAVQTSLRVMIRCMYHGNREATGEFYTGGVSIESDIVAISVNEC